MQRILVIGATGNIGRHVVSQLPAAGVEVRALARNPAAAGLPLEIEVLPGDLTAPESLEPSLHGVDAVFLVWTAPPATAAAAVQRIARHARRIVFVSAPLKTPHPLFQQPNPLRAFTEQMEASIESSGLEWTFLRPGMLASNAKFWWAPQIRAGDVVRWPYPDVPTAPIHEADIAAVAVRALCEDGHAGAEYVLTGPESLTHAEQIATIGRAIGRVLRLEELSPEQAAGEWIEGGWPPGAVKMLLDAWGAAAGHPALVTSTVTEITGAPARSFFEWATENAADFTGSRQVSAHS